MSATTHIPELIDSFYADFEAKLEASPSVIFSGKFGSGKTYFLNDYFARNEGRYCKVYTQPSAYYHAADKDPLSYLKYDILMDLLRQTDVSELQGVQLTYFDMLKAMLIPTEGTEGKNSDVTIIGAAVMLLLMATVGAELGAEKLIGMTKSAWKSNETLQAGLKWLKEKKSKINEDDETKLEEYLKVLGERRNSLFETTAVNELIQALLIRQKEGDADEGAATNKQTVLIVDDLDRMLPDAALSFLSMLSTHVYPANHPP